MKLIEPNALNVHCNIPTDHRQHKGHRSGRSCLLIKEGSTCISFLFDPPVSKQTQQQSNKITEYFIK
ncbi:hypothetical protein QQG55_44790 [Brugia pahangi]